MRFSQLDNVVPFGHSALGELFWRATDRVDELGVIVRRFTRAGDLALFVKLHEEAHLWVHRDYDHDAWLLFGVREAAEVGSDYVAMRRTGGVILPRFFSADAEDLIPAPAKLPALMDVLPVLAVAAATPIDRLVCELVTRAVTARSPHVVYASAEQLFWVDDLDPTLDDLARFGEMLLA